MKMRPIGSWSVLLRPSGTRLSGEQTSADSGSFGPALKGAVLMLLLGLSGATAPAGALVQEFYLPMPEAQIYQANSAIISGTGSSIMSTFSIVVTGDGTVIYYDQWEDGYEVDLANPTQSTTQIWGDGNDANGIPPGFAHDPVGLPAGTVITLTNAVPQPRNPSTLLWDARDRVAANKALVISRAGWPVNPGPVFAGAVGLLSTMDYGTNYISPVGQDLTNNLFKYVGLFLMAAQNNTVLTIDPAGTGIGTSTITLNQGESYLVNGGVRVGGRVTATKPIQADLIIGHVGASYASDWFTLYPVSAWDNAYYTPVSSAASGSQPAYVYLYNPNSSAITINYNTRVGSGSFQIPGPNSVCRYQVPIGSGASFVSAGGQNFFAVCTVAANNTADTSYNWGFTLVPKGALTTEATVGWGPGSADGTVNGSPVWVTALANTRVYVDYKGDHAGPLTDPNGNHYDADFAVTALQSLKIYDPSQNQTGMRVYTVDGTLLTAAWGEDPDVAQPGNPYIDAGTTVLPFPVPVLRKTVGIAVDANPPGLSIGDTIRYTVEVDNKGLLPLGNTVLIDAPPTNLAYVLNSTTLNSSPIPDSASGTPFPLDSPGYLIPIILSQGTTTFTYLCTVLSGGTISNSVNIGGTPISTFATLIPPPTSGASVSLNFTDTNGVPLASYLAGANVFVTMTNAAGNTSTSTVQTISVTVTDTDTSDAETILLVETGANTGVFRNTTPLPTSATSGLIAQDGIMHVIPGDTLSVSYTDPVFLDSASATATIQVPVPAKQLYLTANGTPGNQLLSRVNPPATAGHGTIYSSADIGSETATVLLDSVTTYSNTALTATFPHITSAGANRLMLVGISLNRLTGGSTYETATNVTYAGLPLRFVGGRTNLAGQEAVMYFFALTNPPAGSNNVVVSWNETQTDGDVIGCATFTGVNQTTPYGAFFSNTNTSTSVSLVVTSAPGELVFDTVMLRSQNFGASGSPGANQTTLWKTYYISRVGAGASTRPGAATVTNTWTVAAAADWAIGGVSIKPAPAGGPATNSTSFAQTPAFALPFTMPAGGAVTITNFIAVTNGSAALAASPNSITATLQYNGTDFLTLTNATYTEVPGLNTNLIWSGTLSSNVTIPAGQGITCVLSNSVANTAFHVNYDSTNMPSKVTLPASTVIAINSLGVYDAPYPGGNLVTTPIAGTTLYVRATVSDPFGGYDIASLGLAFAAPLTNNDFNVILNDTSVVASTAASKTYEFQWATGPALGGYTIAATANEGTEGVKANATVGVTTIFLDLGTPSTTEFTSGNNGPPTSAYPASAAGWACVRVTDLDRNTNPATPQAITATITSSSGDSEVLSLTETGTNTGIFTACINTSTNSGAATNDGTLYAPVGSILTANYSDPSDPTDNTSATATIQPAPGVPGIVINKTMISPSGNQVGLALPVTYNLQVVNVGSTTLPSLAITDNFPPAKLRYASAGLPPNLTNATSLAWTNLGALTPGQSTNLTVTFTTLTTGSATNSATANGGTATNSASVVTAINSAALSVTKILLSPTNTPVSVGSNVVFRITVQNVGNTLIPTLPLEDNYSGAYFQFVSATIPPDGSGAGSLVWTNLASPVALATNASITNDITLKVVGQGNPANNTAVADFAADIFGNPVPATSGSTNVVTAAASISGHVYYDINQSGVYATGDTGLANVMLQLFTDPNGDGNPADGTLVQQVTSDANGYYELLNLTLGHYVVVATLLPGYASSGPANGRLALNLTSLTGSNNNNFFQYQPSAVLYSTLSGKVFNDLNGNGTNTSQAGLASVTVDLVQDVNSNGVADVGEPVVTSVATDVNGNYSFAGVTPGRYVIRETDPLGYYSTGDSQPPNDNQISIVTTNGVASTNNSFFDRLLPTAVADTRSAYYLVPLTIYPLANDISPNGDALTLTSVVTADGNVVVNPGSTSLTFTPTNTGVATINYTLADAHGGTSSATIAVNVTALADLAAGKSAPPTVLATSNLVYTISVTNLGPSGASGVVVTDPLPPGVSFVSASANGINNSGVVSWGLGSLASGQVSNLTLTVTAPADGLLTNSATVSSQTPDPAGMNNLTPVVVTLVTNVGASVGGTIWYDANANGTNDVGDSALPSVTVYVDLNGDGMRQANEPFATTDTNGEYQVTSIPAGNYAVRVETNSLPAGVRPTYDLDGTNSPNTVSLSIGKDQVITGVDFGYVGSGSISGYVWDDANGDGLRQAGEPGLAGINVFIDLNANGVRDAGEIYVTTSPSGSFALNCLTASTYRVTIDLSSMPPGLQETFDPDGIYTPNVVSLVLGSGQSMTDANFGYQSQASLSGTVSDAFSALPIPGVTVVVVDSLGTTQTAVTSFSGTYSVSNLWTGPATVTASKPGYTVVASAPTIVVGANTQNEALTPNTLAGAVTNTINGLPIAGATVLVVDSANVTNTLTTDTAGNYALTNIAAGPATVTASKSSYTTATGSPIIVAGANTQDLGLTANTLTGIVTDATTGLPIAGATLSLTDSSNAVHIVTTEATGGYGITNVPTGPATLVASATGYASVTSHPTINPGPNTQNAALGANTLTGVVTNTVSGLPIAGATVLVVDSANVTNTLTTDTAGDYALTNIAAGPATVTASKSGFSTAITSPIITAGANTQDLGLTANTLTGMVTDATTSLPIFGATVSVTDSSNVVYTVTTDATGHYGITNVPTGPATLVASATGYASATAHPTINPGPNTQNAALGANTLTGVVTNTVSHLSIAGATVLVVDSANVTNTLTTDTAGDYALTNIAAGPATVTASKSGYSTAITSPIITAGANIQDLGLTANTLTGIVTDAITSLPIFGANVSVTDSSNVVHTATTDATGYYGITIVPTGPATLVASAIGYASATAYPTISPGANTQDVALTANTLVGVVTNTLSGQPIADVTVLVVDSANVTNTLTTDTAGHYALTNIAAGPATVTASKSGYTTAAASPTIAIGANTQDLGVAANTLTGIVTDATTGLPIPGAVIAVTDSSNVVHTVTTDASGQFGITNVPTGTATLVASATGYTSVTAHPTISPGPNTQNATLGANTLAGVVTNTVSGLTIPGVTVLVVDDANVTNTLTTDATGYYSVSGIAAGLATVTASKSGFTTATANLTIAAGANTQDLGLTANTLIGIVTDATTGLPIFGATIAVTDSSNVVHTVTTDATGHYGITNVPTGTATLVAGATGYASVTAHPTIIPGPNTQNATLGANTLAGVVTNTVTGLPIADVAVLVVDSADITNTLTADASGQYALTNIAAGPATVTASKSGYTTATAGPTIAAGDNTQDLGLTANTLTGTVTDATTGLPIPGAVIAVTDSSNVVHTVTTDAAGHYGITNVPTGTATLVASATGYASVTAHPTINPGPNTQNAALGANTLAGVVTNTVSGLPIADVTVLVVDSANTTNTLSTDTDGHYSLTNIPPGAATVTASKNGYTTITASPTIVAGGNTQDLGLTANTLTGIVTDATTSLPIFGATIAVTDRSNVVHTVTTDATGHYGITNVPTGPATLVASATGYASATSHPTINPGPNIQNAALGANTLAGVVTNTVSGLPIADVAVLVVDSANLTNTLTTDATGYYTVTCIAVGSATVTASKSGYTAASANPTIVPGANTQDLGLTANTLTGIVTDATTGLPIFGATVSVTDSSDLVHTATTDATGHYGITDVPTGPATLLASAADYASATAHPSINPGSNTQNVALGANTLVGVVTNTVSGLLIADVTVLVVDSANVTNTLTTDTAGHYALTNIAAGSATVTASKSGYTTATVSAIIVAGANTQDLGLTANTLTGTVTDATTGLPIPGATIAVTDSSNRVHTATTDATGHYGITDVPTGPATLVASATGYASATSHPTLNPGPNTQNAALGANTLAGVVTNTVSGLPIANVTVLVVDSANGTNALTTDATGYYTISSIAAGSATVTASKSGYKNATANPIIVAGSNTQDLGLTANTLTGIVTDATTSQTIFGATVSVTDSLNVVHTATTDATGRYGVTNLPIGSATLIASATGYVSATSHPTLNPGPNTQDAALSENTLAGVVTDATTGLPIASASVLIADSAHAMTSVPTDSRGHYALANIAAGPATVTASKSGYIPANATLTVAPGPNTQDLQLTSSTPTLAVLSSIKAFAAGNGVRVRWQTASEVGSVCFDLYRSEGQLIVDSRGVDSQAINYQPSTLSTSGAPEPADRWTKVNTEPIVAANSTAGATYEVVDTGVDSTSTLCYRLVELEERGTSQTYGPFRLRPEPLSPLGDTPTAAGRKPSTSANTPSLAHLVQSDAQAAPTVPLGALDGSTFVKITTTNSGIQQVTAASLASFLGLPPAEVQAAIAAGSLRLSNQGEPVAYLPSPDGSALSFYAEALKNNYTAQNVYWLVTATALPPRLIEDELRVDSSGRYQLSTRPPSTGWYQAKLEFEQDLLAVPTLVQEPNQDYWMWRRLVAGLGMFDTTSFPVTLDHLSADGNPTANITLRLMGGSEGTHTVQVMLNGTPIGQATWQGCTPHNTVLAPSAALLVEGTNHLSLKALTSSAGDVSQWYVNGFEFNYPRAYIASGGLLDFAANSNAVIAVDGFTSSAITVLDITDPKRPAVVRGLTITRSTAGYCATFAPLAPQSRFTAFQSGAATPTASLSIGRVAGWSSATNTADYLIFAPESLASAASALASYRQQKGLRTAVVPLDQVYNEFTYGVADPSAIKRLLATALNGWSVKPRYAVLLGTGTYDYRDLLQKHDNLMPPLLVSTPFGLFCSDSAFGDVNDDGQPKIAIGRLPARNAGELLGLVNKIKAYEAQAPVLDAQSLLIADKPDSAGNFSSAIQQVNVTLEGNYSNNVIQCASQNDPTVLRQAVLSGFNAGVDLVDYIGHGAIDRLGNAGYLTSADVPSLQNGSHLPVVVAVTCVSGQFSVPGSFCLAEYLFLQGQGGAIAVVAPTGLSINQDASRLNLRLMQLFRRNTQASIGDIFRQGLADHVSQDKPATQPAIYNLMGDPAVVYNVAAPASPPVVMPRFTGTALSNGVLVITWSGGKPPYQLEQKSAAQPQAPWEPLKGPINGTTATVPLTGPAAIIRLRCAD